MQGSEADLIYIAQIQTVTVLLTLKVFCSHVRAVGISC